MEKRGQIAVEYILIIAIALMILIPAVYVFRNYAFESNERIMEQRLAELSNEIIVKASKIYYYGPPSKSVVSLEMPPQINNMYVLFSNQTDESFFVFNIQSKSGQKDIFYQSDIPLDSDGDICNPNTECLKGFCKCFPERFYSKGLKNFVLEAREVCTMEGSCVVINEGSS